jgi:hypothetical protein
VRLIWITNRLAYACQTRAKPNGIGDCVEPTRSGNGSAATTAWTRPFLRGRRACGVGLTNTCENGASRPRYERTRPLCFTPDACWRGSISPKAKDGSLSQTSADAARAWSEVFSPGRRRKAS